MTEDEFTRPRRALGPSEDVPDDTPTEVSERPRRGQDWQPVEPKSFVPPPSGGRRFSAAALPEGHKSVARRSATSALSPTGIPTPAEPKQTPRAAALEVAFKDQPKEKSRPARAIIDEGADERPEERDRFWWYFWAVAGIAGLALLAGAILAATRPSAGPPVAPTVTATPAVAPFTNAALWTGADLAAIGKNTQWFVGQTLNELSPASPRPACLTAVLGDVKPQLSAQRTLTTSTSLAGLHQIDSFADPTAAGTVFKQRLAAIAACDEAPAQIVGSSAVTGLGDEAALVTIAYQNTVTEYHTLLLVRSNTLISTFDVAQAETAIPAQALVDSAALALHRGCAIGGSCPTTPALKPAAPPTTKPAGWLVPADFPRISPGVGIWTATDPAAVTTTGSGCENLTLSSAPGPTERTQRTFVLTQDPNAPAGFGVDELLFTFADPAQATAFAKTLGDNVAGCGDRLQTATVASATPISAVVGEVPVAARTFALTQATAADAKVHFQLAISQVGNKVTYMVINTNETFRLSDEQLAAVIVRSAERATQLS